jgi:hypothetical protein
MAVATFQNLYGLTEPPLRVGSDLSSKTIPGQEPPSTSPVNRVGHEAVCMIANKIVLLLNN